MAKILIVGAGITGGYMAFRLLEAGADIALLARGEKADRLEREGLKLKDAISGVEQTVRIPVLRQPVTETFDIVMVCVQEIHRPGLLELLGDLPGRPVAWYMGNTIVGYNSAAERLGRDRVLGGFPSVGGTWEGDILLYADRKRAKDPAFDNPVAGAPYQEARPALERVVREMAAVGQDILTFDPIMDWHYCHAALILPLAAAFYMKGADVGATVKDGKLLRRTMRSLAAGVRSLEGSGHEILPEGLKKLSKVPPFLGAMAISRLLRSRFGQVALAGHASTARDEMHSLAAGLLEVLGDGAKKDFREFLSLI